ncbi:MAG: dTDP-4-dehydrorhamnose 3,5-epimerase [Candidatus Hydrogenedens sp.]|nr:dTDP-4-dehydrorhamnose 3,5-epimerase [Candidatus Hydrogenedens sp.]
MRIYPTCLAGVVEIVAPVYSDDRGFFTEVYNQESWAAAGFHEHFVQDNLSLSQRGVLRGLHFQLHPRGMGKLMRVLTGTAFDVLVDLRRGSPTYGQWLGRMLEAGDPRWLFAPPGFAHGFLALEDDTRMYYKCTSFYREEAERSLFYNDPAIGIRWPETVIQLSEKDASAPMLHEVETNFVYTAEDHELAGPEG